MVFPITERNVMNIYVADLPLDARESDLRSLFADHGTIESAHVITDRETEDGTELSTRR